MEKKIFSLGLMFLTSAGMKNTPEFEKEQVEVWWFSLKDLDGVDYLHTCRELIKLESWFPAIADIRRLVNHPSDPVLAAANRRLAKLKITQQQKPTEEIKDGKSDRPRISTGN